MALRDEHRTTSELEKCSAGTQAVGRKARLELVFAERQGRTILEHARVESPLKITRPYYPENTGTAQLILMSPAPGIFGGDDWTLRVRVKAGAWVQIAPQGALRVHPAPEESPARQRVELFVEAGADLHWEMEPAIPFRDSVLHQQVCIHLEPEARLFYWEAFCSGRVRHGEPWEFKELRQDLECWRGDELLLLDRYRLCPQGRSPNPGYAPRASHYFASVLVQDGNDSNALRKREAGTESEGVWAVDTPAADFLVGRMIASDGLAFRRERAGFHNTVLPALGRVVPQFRRG